MPTQSETDLGSPTRVPGGRHQVAGASAQMPELGSLIHARGLTKRFGELVAVDAVDFDVAPGEAFGFLGPNGAGKTSTMRMIGCVSPVTAGGAPGGAPGSAGR